MSGTFKTYEFSGVDTRKRLPPSYTELLDVASVASLASTVEALERKYGAVEAPVAYYDEFQDEYVEVEAHTAVVNPAWLGDTEDRDFPVDAERENRDDAAWYVFTDSYTPAGPDQLYASLVERLREMDESVFGQFRLYRDGGRAHMDVFMEDYEVEMQGSKLVLGFSTGHDHFGSQTLYAEACAYQYPIGDDDDGVVLRQLSDTYKRKHVGEATDELRATWESVIDRFDTITDEVYSAVHDSMEYMVPLSDLPIEDDLELFTHIGLPETTIAPVAANILPSENKVSAFSIYRAGVQATNQEMGSTDGQAYRSHISNLNPWLFAPPMGEKRMLSSANRSLKMKMEERKADPQSQIVDSSGDRMSMPDVRSQSEAIQSRIETVDEGVSLYNSVQEQLEGLMSGNPSEAEGES